MFAFAGILLGMVSSIIMQTILATVLPGIVHHLGNDYWYGWVFSGYLIASTVTIPIFAKLTDLYGRKLFYLSGLVLFLAGSALCGTASSMVHLVLYRIVQGLGAGALAPAAIAMISDLFSIEDRGKMMGILAAVQVLANVAGPLIGGVIADNFGWQWAFYANLPTGLLAIILVSADFKETKPVTEKGLGRVDFTGGLLLGSAIVLLIQSFQMIGFNGPQWPVLLMTALAAFIFALFLWQEKNHPDPVVSFSLIAIKNVNLSLFSTFLLGAMMFGSIVILPLYSQMVFGGTALQGGKLLLPFTVGLGVGGIFSGRLTKRISYANLAAGGWTLTTVGFFSLAVFSGMELHYFSLAVLVMASGLGLGAALPTFLLTGQNAVSENQRAVVGGLLQISRNLGGALCIPVFTGIIAPVGGKITGGKGQYAFLALFLTLSAMSAVGAVVGARFEGSVHTDQQKEILRSGGSQS